MAFQPAPSVAQVILRYGDVSSGVFWWANVLNFVKDGGTNFTVGDLETLNDYVAQWYATSLKGLMCSAYGLLSVSSRGMDSQEAPYADITVNDVGGVSGEPLPINVSAVITLRTAFTGRSARGRIYHAGLSEVQSEGSQLTAGVVTGLNASYQDLRSQASAEAGAQLCVLSRTSNGVDRELAMPFVVTSATLRDGVFDTQSRRIDRLK